MPVIIQEKYEDEWLSFDNQEFDKLFNLLKPYPEKEMKFNLVSKQVNNPMNDDEALIAPFKNTQIQF